MKHKFMFLIIICAQLAACSSLLPTPDAPVATAPRHAVGDRGAAVLLVLLTLGIDYRPGGQSHETGFDCSGLVAHVYREAFGLRLPHDTAQQSRQGTPVPRSELEPGDLVFYNTLGRPYSHVGLYIGDGRFVHAPRSGATVRIERVDAAYWAQRFNGGRRIQIES